jgi:hypothetical protein
MTNPEITRAIQEALPELIASDPSVRDFVLRTVSNYYADKEETQSRFDRILADMQRDREEQNRKWEEDSRRWEESNRKWEESNRKWEEQTRENRAIYAEIQEQNRKWEEDSRRWEEQTRENRALRAEFQEESRKSQERWEEQTRENQVMLAEIQDQKRRYDSTIGALGARWGLYSEASFRNALRGILEESFGVQVLNITDFDESGEVFGRPDQIELDLIIKNGQVIICEIKSSFSKSDMYIFSRKVEFYQKRHERPVTRKLVISPMVDDRALPIAEDLGIEVYSYADSVRDL